MCVPLMAYRTLPIQPSSFLVPMTSSTSVSDLKKEKNLLRDAPFFNISLQSTLYRYLFYSYTHDKYVCSVFDPSSLLNCKLVL